MKKILLIFSISFLCTNLFSMSEKRENECSDAFKRLQENNNKEDINLIKECAIEKIKEASDEDFIRYLIFMGMSDAFSEKDNK